MSSLPLLSPQPMRGKGIAIRKQDGDAFTRVDIQYDFLDALFSDDTKVFTELTGQDLNADPKLSFGELYVNSLIRISKCSKPLRDKMFENPHFARDYAKLALLANVGRVNSTQACKPRLSPLRTSDDLPVQSSQRCALR